MILDHSGFGKRSEVLLIGGRSGVGKSTVGWEVSELLQQDEVAHAIIEGDFMGQVHPAPSGDPHRSMIVERNLTAVWANYRALGYHRLIYTNTVSVLEGAMFERALGPGTKIIRVLLTAEDRTARERLSQREQGSLLELHLQRSSAAAESLELKAPTETVRVATDDRTVVEIARDVVVASGWAEGPG